MQNLSGESGNLYPCLRTIIISYEKILIEREIQYDLEKILICLVNMFVNILDIKII